MNPDKMKEFKSLFEIQKNQMIQSREAAIEELSLPKEDLFDEVDLTSAEMEQSMRIRLRNRQALYLKKIEQALVRIQDGSFGACQNCDEEIELRRLEARPTTTHCVSCKEEQERKEQIHIDGHKNKSMGSPLRLRLA